VLADAVTDGREGRPGGVTADVLPEAWEKAVQVLHEQAGHATAYADACREPGCLELYRGNW
jgi:hypothetical protein